MVRVLVQAFLDTELWNVRHVQSIPGDDDPEAVIAVQQGEAREEVTLWVSEVDRQPTFARSQHVILELIRTVSNGEVREVGR